MSEVTVTVTVCITVLLFLHLVRTRRTACVWTMRAAVAAAVAAVLLLHAGGTRASSMPAPQYTVPLGVSVNARTDVCRIQAQVLNGTIALRDALRGLSLSMVFEDTPPYSEVDDSGILVESGVLVAIADELGKRAGFSWRNSYAVLKSPAGQQTYTDWLLYAVREYDIVANWFLHTPDRINRGASFPEGWYCPRVDDDDAVYSDTETKGASSRECVSV